MQMNADNRRKKNNEQPDASLEVYEKLGKSASISVPSVLIAAPSSGSGKTTISLGIMAALRKRGRIVQPFKVGPDFIDPGHHTAVCGRASRNLDGWMLSKDYVVESFLNACHPHPNPLPS